jgi:DNA-binding CsgD family transcriptional regulator
MNSLILTEKQQQVLWLRYGRRASINQIAEWLHISRRAVLARMRNARRRAGRNSKVTEILPILDQKIRVYPASQITTEGGGPLRLDEI